MSIPGSSIEFVEVGPRDGLQNEKLLVSTQDKLALISRAIDAGARRIEVTSFVNPTRVPQMADAEAVCAGFCPSRDDVTFIGLVMNMRGAERALATGRIDQPGGRRRGNGSFRHGQSGPDQRRIGSGGQKHYRPCQIAEGRTAQCTIAASFGCPFEGEVAQDRVVEMATLRLAEAGPVEIALADTIGVGNPAHVG